MNIPKVTSADVAKAFEKDPAPKRKKFTPIAGLSTLLEVSLMAVTPILKDEDKITIYGTVNGPMTVKVSDIKRDLYESFGVNSSLLGAKTRKGGRS